MYFLASDCTWRCKQNSNLCTLNGTHDSTNELRCKIPRAEWEFTEPAAFSIVKDFDIFCEKQWLLELCTGMFFLGACIGGLCLVKIADSFGRKIVLFTTLTMLLSIAVASTFVPNIYLFIACRFLIGTFYSPCLGQILVIMAMELVQSNRRSFIMNGVWVFYSLALCLVALKAYFIKTWKVFLLVSTCPYYVALLFYFQIPESIQWLLAKRKKAQSEEVLMKIAKQNRRSCSTMIPSIYISRTALGELQQAPSTSFSVIFFPLKTALMTFVQCYTWFVTSMVYYGLLLAASDLGGSIYLNFALVSVMECPGHIVGAFLSNKIGRKMTASIPMCLAGLLCFAIPHIPGDIGYVSIILDMTGKLLITMCIYLWSSELYPTDCRAKAVGLLQVFEMLGGMASPFIVKSIASKDIAFSIFGACALFGSVLMMTLRDTLEMTNVVSPGVIA